MDNSWKLAEYTVSELQEAIETNKITIPKYQRGFVWGKDKQGNFIGGWAAEYVEYFDTYITDEIARAHAEMWLTKSLNHELMLRNVDKHSEFQFYHKIFCNFC